MKITSKQYAISLFESVKGKKDKEASAAVKKFFDVLVANNQTGQMNKIIDQFLKMWNTENGIVESEFFSAQGLDKETVKLLTGYIAKHTGAKQVIVSQKVDKDILGGVVIKYEDQILDGSLKTRLKNLKEQMVK